MMTNGDDNVLASQEATGRKVTMKVSDVIRELELMTSLSPKTIHILGNMMADVAWCKQGIKQQFECYAELIAIVKGLNAFLSLNSDALEHAPGACEEGS
jgi:hypothetical protein